MVRFRAWRWERFYVVPLLLAFVAAGSFAPDGGGLRAQIVNSESALLSWTPPTQNEDGTALTDLSHYYAYYGDTGQDPTKFPNKVQIGGNLSSFMIEALPEGTWCFAMTAVNSAGAESEFSNVACKTIDPLAPEPTRPKAPGGLVVQSAEPQ